MNLIVRARPSETERGKVVIAIGKSVAKKASSRNLIKRRIRAVLAPESRKLRLDFAVTVKPSAAEMSFTELKNELTGQVNNLKK